VRVLYIYSAIALRIEFFFTFLIFLYIAKQIGTNTIKNAIKSGDIIRTQITPDNLKQVFDKWVIMIGNEIKDVEIEDNVYTRGVKALTIPIVRKP
jgi:uncharacterized protein with ACT and thioredoxin-like domain